MRRVHCGENPHDGRRFARAERTGAVREVYALDDGRTAGSGGMVEETKLVKRDARPSKRGGLIRRLAAVALFLTIGTGVSCVFTRPSRARIGVAPAALDAESVAFPSASGALLHAWFAPGRARGGAVLLLHGVGADRRVMLDRARFLRAEGYAVLLPDFQAHGESAGQYITFGALESRDALAALAYLRARAPGEPVGIVGVSMGGAAAVLANEHGAVANAYVLESMYPTIRDAVHDRLRAWLGPIGPVLGRPLIGLVGAQTGIVADSLRPIDRIGQLGAPVLVAAGTRDRYTTIAESESLYERASAPKEFWAVEGAAHVDLYAYAGAEYERRVGSFLARYLRPATTTARGEDAAAGVLAVADSGANPNSRRPIGDR